MLRVDVVFRNTCAAVSVVSVTKKKRANKSLDIAFMNGYNGLDNTGR